MTILMAEMDDCIFCKIIKGEISTEIVTQTKNLIVIKDIKPAAPIHFLIIPKKHVADMSEDNGVLWVAARTLALKIAKQKGIKGFRLAVNVGEAAATRHMHVHFLGGISADREV